MKWALLLIGIAANAGASLLVKLAVEPPRSLPTFTSPWTAFTNWPLIGGVALYCGAFLVYALTLTRLPINVAHPILTSGAIAVVALGAGVLYGETFRWTTIVGIALVIAGVTMISQRAA